MFFHTPSNTLNSCHGFKTPAISNSLQMTLNCLSQDLPSTTHGKSLLSGKAKQAFPITATRSLGLTGVMKQLTSPDLAALPTGHLLSMRRCVQKVLLAFPFLQHLDSFSHLFDPLEKANKNRCMGQGMPVNQIQIKTLS